MQISTANAKIRDYLNAAAAYDRAVAGRSPKSGDTAEIAYLRQKRTDSWDSLTITEQWDILSGAAQ
mgnify:CR=1 FL=1